VGPSYDSHPFANSQQRAREVLQSAGDVEAVIEQRRDDLLDERRRANDALKDALEEVRALEGKRSNMPGYLLNLRTRMCQELGLEDEELPFAGELIQVRKEEERWRGAIERVLSGFAKTLLVEQRLYRKVADWVDRNHLGGRLTYDRMEVRQQRASDVRLAANSLVRKLETAPEHQEWLNETLRVQFDMLCVETSDDLMALERGVTLAGQVKRSRMRHEKDDRTPLNDQRSWLLGFSNHEKLQALAETVTSLNERVGALGAEINSAETERNAVRAQARWCQAVVDATWVSCNVAGVLEERERLTVAILREKQDRPALEQLKENALQAKLSRDRATERRQRAEGIHRETVSTLNKLEMRAKDIPAEHLSIELTPTQQASLLARFDKLGHKLTVDNLSDVAREVRKAVDNAYAQVQGKQKDAERDLQGKLQAFCHRWPAAAEGLDASLAAAPEFMAKLVNLEGDGIARFVDKFKELLREQSFQNLAVLSTRLDNERRAINDRLDQVNESLARSPFDENTFLRLEHRERHLPEVVQFRQQLKAALAHSFREDDQEELEKRFAEFNAVVTRLKSQDPVDEKWTRLVLDVRQQVEFSAIEHDLEGREVERHDSGSGKSGGQRQKLATTCLAAALRYQLAGEDGHWPTYCTVVMDEAFDRADADFTKMVLNIFSRLGFQVVAATPVKNVMAMESFIEGATFVSIRDRKYSQVLPINYVTREDGSEGLNLPQEVLELRDQEMGEDVQTAYETVDGAPAP